MPDGAAVDEIGRSLRDLADDLEQRLDEAAVVERDDVLLGAVHLRPVRSGAQAVGWIDLGQELQVYTGTRGRWKLDRTTDDIAFIRDVCEAVIAGRGHEVHALQRSRVVLRLAKWQDRAHHRLRGMSADLRSPAVLDSLGQAHRVRPYESDNPDAT